MVIKDIKVMFTNLANELGHHLVHPPSSDLLDLAIQPTSFMHSSRHSQPGSPGPPLVPRGHWGGDRNVGRNKWDQKLRFHDANGGLRTTKDMGIVVMKQWIG